MKLEELIKDVNTIVREVGEYISSQKDHISSKDIDTKGIHDLVTFVDKRSERMLIDHLSRILPGSGFLVEEQTVENEGKEYTWIIDPLDGTTNYIHGLPAYSISVALMKDEEVIMGTVLDVEAGECYYSWKDGPAFLNDNIITVSKTASLGDSLLATGFPYSDFENLDAYLKMFRYLMENTRGIRRFGSAAIDLAWVACGRFDGFWEYSLKPWDVAAGSFIVIRAGGLCSDFSGGTNFLFGREIVCGNPYIYPDLLELSQKMMNKE